MMSRPKLRGGDSVAIVDVSVDGLDEIVNELARMPEEGKKKLHQAVNKGAEYLSPKIKGAIQRGDSKDGHHLKDAIKVRKAKQKKTAYQSADVVAGKGKQVDYGFHVEVGTRKTKGKNFMRSTTDAEAEAVANIMIDDLLNSLGV